MTPILMYHEITREVSSNKYSISESAFEEHLNLIKTKGLSACSLSGYLKKGGDVIITFDDGYLSDYLIAYPLLMRFDFTATFYITTNRVTGVGDHLNWEQITEMDRNGMDMQVHSHTHEFLDIKDLSKIKEELVIPTRLFKEQAGLTVSHFSLPGGRFNNATIRLAKEAGYKTLATSQPRFSNINSKDFQLLNRFVIHQNTSDKMFKNIVDKNTKVINKRYLYYRAKYYLKKILGNKIYQMLWTWLMK